MAVDSSVGQIFGAHLRELRRKRGLTQVQLSELSAFPQSHISELENGTRMPSLVSLLRLAAALDYKITDLVTVFNAEDLQTLLKK